MHLIELELEGFKGVKVRLPWNRLNVLFGPNDAGKTNILEAVATALGAPDLARTPSRASDSGLKVSAVLELEANEGDDELLAALLQRDHVPPIFPTAARRGEHGRTAHAAEQPISPARLRWAGMAPGGRSFSLTKVAANVGSGTGGLPALDDLRQGLHERALRAMKDRMRDPKTWADAETLLSVALGSRCLRFERGILSLLCPVPEDWSSDLVAAGKRLAKSGWRSDAVLGPFVTQLADRTVIRQPILRMADRRDLRPFDVVWAAAQGREGDDLEAALRREFDGWHDDMRGLAESARELRRILRRSARLHELVDALGPTLELTKAVSNTSPSDRWLRHVPMDSDAPARWVWELAARTSAEANRLAAPMIKEGGTLGLDVLNARHWLGDRRRLKPVPHQPHRNLDIDEQWGTPLEELGLGLRAWSSVAIREGAAAQREELRNALDGMRAIVRVAREPLEEGEGPGSGRAIIHEFGSKKRLLIVDEPEQHLHPRAQHEIAAWLATGAEERETLLATHALPFLNMATEQTSYMLVTRGADGLTRADDISHDVFGSLESMSAEAGLSGRAEALQTLRAVALVEGSHDERVLHHFFGEDLARRRILVVPVRGAQNVNAILDAPWLSRLGLPLIILFDEVRASVVEGKRRPSRRDIAARAVWDLLHHWQEPRPRPYVASFELPDIFRALPEECLRRAIQRTGGSFPGWKAIDAAFDRNRSAGFKKVLLQRSKMPADADLDSLLGSALDTCRTKPQPGLRRAVQVLIDHAQMSER